MTIQQNKNSRFPVPRVDYIPTQALFQDFSIRKEIPPVKLNSNTTRTLTITSVTIILVTIILLLCQCVNLAWLVGITKTIMLKILHISQKQDKKREPRDSIFFAHTCFWGDAFLLVAEPLDIPQQYRSLSLFLFGEKQIVQYYCLRSHSVWIKDTGKSTQN